MTRWTLEIELLSDTCFAGGDAGRTASVDHDVDLDPVTRLPVIRGRSLKGLLVEEWEAMESLVGADTPRDASLADCAAGLFGRAGDSEPGRAWFGDATLSSQLRSAVLREPDLARHAIGALTVVRQQTAIDAETGSAAAGSLRGARLLRRGLRFRAPLDVPDGEDPAVRRILALSCAAVSRAGLHRNRGWGEIRIRLLDESGRDRTLVWMDARGDQSAPSVSRTDAPTGTQTGGGRPTPHGPAVVTYRITLRAPAVFADLQGDDGTIESLPYVPGSALAGAAGAAYLRQQSLGGDAAADPRFRALFLSGAVRWLHAYPESFTAAGGRMLPVPAGLAAQKVPRRGQPVVVENRLRVAANGSEWRTIRGGFAFLREAPVDGTRELEFRSPGVSLRLHHRRSSREAGRPTHADLFSYASLEAGSSFVGHVLIEHADLVAVVERMLASGGLRFGRSRSATYGGDPEIELLRLEPGGPAAWMEARPDSAVSAPAGTVVTLLSDLIARNENGAISADAARGLLARSLGISADPVIEVGSMGAIVSTRPVGGHVGWWRMPRPTVIAVTAGSRFVFDQVATPEAVAAACWAGVGERRAAGFGRIAVGWAVARQWTLRDDSVSRGAAAVLDQPPPNAETSADLELVRGHARFARACDAARLRAREISLQESRLPTPSAISRLRNCVASEGVIGLQALLADPELSSKPFGKALEKCRVGRSSLLAHLRNLRYADVCDIGATAVGGRNDGVVHPGSIATPDPEDESVVRLYLDVLFDRLRRASQAAAQKETHRE